MALLTADDVRDKAFSKTKYREGFDQDEVDDFLDEVAHTIAQLTAERDELAARLQETPRVAAAVEPPSTEAGLLGAATEPTPPNPTGMLALAQKLHDEYVSAGEAEKERLVEEAKVKAEAIVERADADAAARMDALSGERAALEGKIDDLRRFEKDYRSRLKSYLANLLGDLDHAEGTAPAPVATYVGEELLPAGDQDSDQAPEFAVADAVVASAVDESPGVGSDAADVDVPANADVADVAEVADASGETAGGGWHFEAATASDDEPDVQQDEATDEAVVGDVTDEDATPAVPAWSMPVTLPDWSAAQPVAPLAFEPDAEESSDAQDEGESEGEGAGLGTPYMPVSTQYGTPFVAHPPAQQPWAPLTEDDQR